MNLDQKHVYLRSLTVLVAVLGISLSASPQGFERTALDEYVAVPDRNYEYSVVVDELLDGFRHVVVDMVSQQWLTEEEDDKPIW